MNDERDIEKELIDELLSMFSGGASLPEDAMIEINVCGIPFVVGHGPAPAS